MIVYVVTEGSYSDYHICGIFDDKELAERAAHVYGGEIEEWPVNQDADLLRSGFEVWIVYITDNGEIIQTRKENGLSIHETREEPFRFDWSRLGEVELQGWGYRVLATDKEHAQKIATDKRAEQLARLAGV